ncbi:subtilase family protein [Primorskyibacter sedentarius]|uniref:Subtilase family protein n=1 Tax=Primorskyibacter sedentarius TaxID=745311 RepID=A0A4V2ULI3_9RHOB|nr:S8 family serine peptidase [Primorskyibacter sedentarius]TCS51115.1 subtilase family protein [Primorskyibacter sedentarius]
MLDNPIRARALKGLEDVLISFGATSEALFSDTPIRVGVWREIAANPDRKQRLLIELNNRMRLDEAADMLQGARPLVQGEADFRLQVFSAGELTLAQANMDDLIALILPQTVWFRALDAELVEAWRGEVQSIAVSESLAQIRSIVIQSKSLILWRFLVAWLAIRSADIAAHQGEDRWDYLIRITGALMDVTETEFDRTEDDEREVFGLVREFLREGLQRYGQTLNQLIAGQRELGRAMSAPIWRVDISRSASLATRMSRRTVKVDAAENVFDISCSGLTWAVIDSGIDAGHPAFQDRGKVRPGPNASRIRATYDFTRLQRFLNNEWNKVFDSRTTQAIKADHPGIDLSDAILTHLLGLWLRTGPRRSASMEFISGLLAEDSSRMDLAGIAGRIKRQITRGAHLDWPLLEPLLWVPPDADYIPPRNGHGTHVAGILAGDLLPGEADPGDGSERVDRSLQGMCPDMKLLDLRVCDINGQSDEFVVMAALQFVAWLNRQQRRQMVQGVNVSLQLRHIVRSYGCGQTPVCREANALVSSGVLVVAAAGNTGYSRLRSEDTSLVEAYGTSTIMDPGNAEHVLTVGSVHSERPHTHGISYFSSRGPTIDGRTKPDVVAPGEKILAPSLEKRILRDSGTSMAAPHASGAAALLMARFPELQGRPFDVKSLIIKTATSLDRDPAFQGHGMVDVLRALQHH